MKIRAAVVYEPNTPFVIDTLDLQPPQKEEVLVRIAAAGVCRSDWNVLTGDTKHPMPVVTGHEGAGYVEAVGPGVTHVQPGDRVALNWAPNCGECFYCLNDRPSLCETYIGPIWAGTMMDGTPRLFKDGQPLYQFCSLGCFAEYAVVPAISCVPIPDGTPLGIAALIGCAVTTGVGAALNTAHVKAGSTVVVYGAGGVGLNVVMGAKLSGAKTIIAVDRAQAKRDIALSFGATDFVPAGADAVEAVRALTGGRGADYAFEATGVPAVQEECLDAVRPGGLVVFAGLAPMGSVTNLPGAVLTRTEKTVTGSYYGTSNTKRDFPQYADLYMRGLLDLDRLISKTYSLDQINEAYAGMLTGGMARGVIVLEGSALA
jgi:S-(hydroxymethyl)glutathione dehydrogenase / alcohol dehydrogenase